MALDEAMAGDIREGQTPPTLRFYAWDTTSVSIGRFQRAGDLDRGYLKEQGIPLVRRPTGGRAVLHGSELTYSFSAGTREGPFSRGLLESYRDLAYAFSRAFCSLGISAETIAEKRSAGARSPLCFASPSSGEITVGRRKVIGSAQKRWPDGLLQQGSIPFQIDYARLGKVLRSGAGEPFVRAGMAGLGEFLPGLQILELKAAIRDSFEKVFGVEFLEATTTIRERGRAEELLQGKYLSPGWNLRR